MIRKRRNQKKIPFQKPRWEKQIDNFYIRTKKMSEQIFPNRWPPSYRNLTKTYKRFRQHIIRLQNIKLIEPQQKYCIGTINYIKLLGLKPVICIWYAHWN